MLTHIISCCSEKKQEWVVRNFTGCGTKWLDALSQKVIDGFDPEEYHYTEEPPYNPPFFEIPAGDAIERDMSDFHILTLPMPYEQGELPLCVLYSVASVLKLYGDSIADEVQNLKDQIVDADARRNDRCPRMTFIFDTIHSSKRIKWTPAWLQGFTMTMGHTSVSRPVQSSSSLENPLSKWYSSNEVAAAILKRLPIDSFLLLQLKGADLSTTHAICVVPSTVPSAATKQPVRLPDFNMPLNPPPPHPTPPA